MTILFGSFFLLRAVPLCTCLKGSSLTVEQAAFVSFEHEYYDLLWFLLPHERHPALRISEVATIDR